MKIIMEEMFYLIIIIINLTPLIIYKIIEVNNKYLYNFFIAMEIETILRELEEVKEKHGKEIQMLKEQNERQEQEIKILKAKSEEQEKKSEEQEKEIQKLKEKKFTRLTDQRHSFNLIGKKRQSTETEKEKVEQSKDIK